MHHSYEALERPGGTSRRGLSVPLRRRDFRLLWIGMCVSLLGDGAFVVALAWQVYQLSDAPTAMGMVGVAMTVPTIVFLLVGGALSDRFNRRLLMLAADAARLAAAAALAVLSLSGTLEIWHVGLLVAVYGTGQAFFAPAFDAIVPDLVPTHELAQANALDQLIRPIALRMAGPAIGGVLVGGLGAGAVFALDAASFGVSAAMLLLMRPVSAPRGGEAARGSVIGDLREGWRFVRERAWLWVTFSSAAVAYLLFMGPVEVLVPYVVKHDLGAAASDLGLIFGAGGLASLLTAVAFGRLGLPRRSMTFIYVVWTAATLAVAGYGLGTAVWQFMLASALFNALETAGTIVWITAKQHHVPSHMLGRVSSLDWLISIGLLPLSFALTGPVSAAIGAQTTLVVAGVAGAAVTFGGLFVPGVRAIERRVPREAAVEAAEPVPVNA
jgi:DHA3 family tetracycline resistance protein-like MFS transporter